MKVRVIAEVLGVLALLGAVMVAYHELANTPLYAKVESVQTEFKVMAEENTKQLDNIEAAVTVDRIVRLDKIRCSGTMSSDLQAIMQQNLARYYELTGREFSKPECRTD